MTTVHARDAIGRGVAPLVLLLIITHIDIDGVHDGIDIIVAVALLVEVVGHQLRGGIAGATTHATETGIDHHVAASLRHQTNKAQRQGEGHLLVVVGVDTHLDAFVQVGVETGDNALEVFLVHGPEGIDHRQ